MKFSIVGAYFQRIEATASRLEMTQLLAELFSKANPEQAQILANLCLGQLHPPYEATQLNIAQALMIRAVAQLLHRDSETIEKQVKACGDVGLVVEQGIWSHQDVLTVTQVYDTLCTIEAVQGAGSQEDKIRILVTLLEQLDAVSAKYVTRIVIGKLRLGFSDMTLVDALSWMLVGDKSLREAVEDAYNRCADIGYITYELKKKGPEVLKHMQVQVGIPIRPAGAERLPTPQAIIDKIGPCVAQQKIDGFRLQIHLDKTGKTPKIHFFSRHLTDMSHMFPDLVKVIMPLPVTTMIAEGEAIVYDEQTQSYVPFQETVKRKRKHDIENAAAEYPLHLIVFDLLYLDGVDLLDTPHEQRRSLLAKILQQHHTNVMHIIDEKLIVTAQELADYFTVSVAAGLEGLVVKRPDAVYQAGKRNFNWIKLKRHETGTLEDTVDCVVLGYNKGQGKRSNFGIGAFLVGVYNKQNDTFETIAKIGTGLKDDDWLNLKKKCDVRAVTHQPKQVVCAKELYPDVWVNPELVVLVRADDITISPVHTAGKDAENLGYALRFPRFMGYREDKGPTEATTVDEVISLYRDQFVR